MAGNMSSGELSYVDVLFNRSKNKHLFMFTDISFLYDLRFIHWNDK